MKKDDIIQSIQTLRAITPRDEFTQRSRAIVLSSPRMQTSDADPSILTQPALTLARTFTIGLRIASFTFTGIILVVGSLYAARELSPLFLPGLNTTRITAEAEMVQSRIDIQLSNINYLKETSQESSRVLQQVSQKSLNHLNTDIIKKEESQISEPVDTASLTNEINDALSTLSQ